MIRMTVTVKNFAVILRFCRNPGTQRGFFMTGCRTKKKRGGTWLNNLILRDFFIGGAALFRETHFWLQ